MNAGRIGTLLMYGTNPAYTWYDAEKCKTGLKKVKFSVSFSPKNDETTQLAQYVIPDHNYLASCGDAGA